MARISRETGGLPIIVHAMGMSKKLFLAICDKVEESLGGEKALCRITKKVINEEIGREMEAYRKKNKEITKENKEDGFFGESRIYFLSKRTVYLYFTVVFINESTGEVQLYLSFPLLGGTMLRQKAVVEKIIEKSGLSNCEWNAGTGNLKKISVYLDGEDAPVQAGYNPDRERGTGYFYVTRGESVNMNIP